ncbi:MAG TPA: FecR family protein [Paraburkholderia sp.]|uniref:FecR family protein n=1 Tax=Paraburkholderia sp. TaxID=1926495 RepID=UPI002B476415|nr:FecR family protein [Paraburkholderia sp.]HKR43982.1 FecR family protein [Paraburkholderia sp.]
MPSRTLWGPVAIVLSVVCASGAAQTAPSDQKDEKDRTGLQAHEGSATADIAGKAVVVVGQVKVANARGTSTLASGASVTVGDTIETGADGYVYVTTVDHGFISVRPNSSFSIERYDYDANTPERAVIKLALHRGVVREISGRGAQAARDHYRMNTPVAALGVRGTDFTVFTDANITSASVRSGGIVMTPLGNGCAASGSGPCEGSNAAQLFADLTDKALQVTRGNAHPVLLDTHLTPLTTEKGSAGQKTEDNAAHAAVAVTHVDPGVAPQELTFPLNAPSTTAAPTTPPTAPSKSAAPEAQQVFWGRYTALANLPADATLPKLMETASDQSGLLGAFAIVRTPQSDMVMPAQGSFNFGLQSYEAYLVNASTSTATAAAISNGTLAINFGAHTFTTNLVLNANGASYAVSSSGGVSNNGKLFSDYVQPMAVRGGLAGKNATQAAYTFSQQLGNNQSLTGATLWSR